MTRRKAPGEVQGERRKMVQVPVVKMMKMEMKMVVVSRKVEMKMVMKMVVETGRDRTVLVMDQCPLPGEMLIVCHRCEAAGRKYP